jgi:hypothetical protein
MLTNIGTFIHVSSGCRCCNTQMSGPNRCNSQPSVGRTTGEELPVTTQHDPGSSKGGAFAAGLVRGVVSSDMTPITFRPAHKKREVGVSLNLMTTTPKRHIAARHIRTHTIISVATTLPCPGRLAHVNGALRIKSEASAGGSIWIETIRGDT